MRSIGIWARAREEGIRRRTAIEEEAAWTKDKTAHRPPSGAARQCLLGRLGENKEECEMGVGERAGVQAKNKTSY